MARIKSDDNITPSLLDRLIDLEPDTSTEPVEKQFQDLRMYQRSILRDVENLLNTRRGRDDITLDCAELQQSVLAFGLPDFSAAGVGSEAERNELGRLVELALRNFEPRLSHVRVTVRELESDSDRTIRMSIDAMLLVDPDPVPIAFDTILQPSSGSCSVEPK